MPIEDLQMALNSSLNQYLTNANQQLNNMWITSDTRIPEWEFISRPNGVIHVSGDINNLKEVQHKDITGTALSMMNNLEQKITRTTGITDQLLMGDPGDNVGTATGQQLQQNNLDVNLRFFMTMLEQVAIKKIAQHFLSLNKQFITSEQIIKIAGRHGYSHQSIKPDDVSAAFDPIVIPNSTLPKNPMVRVQNLLNLQALAAKDQTVKVNTAPIWKEIVDDMGMTDLDEIVPDDIDEAAEENELLKKNVPVECEPNDNHDKHIMIHQYPLISGEIKDKATVERFIEHIKTHKKWKLAADPELLEKMANNRQPTPGNISDDPAQAVQPPLVPGMVPTAPLPPIPLPNAATGDVGLVQQEGQQLAGAPLPEETLPLGSPEEEPFYG